MITEDYVSFETAKLLKEKGFNEKCRYVWELHKANIVGDTDGISKVCSQIFMEGESSVDNSDIERVIEYNGWSKSLYEAYLCPTLQVVRKWFLKKYNIFISVLFLEEYNGFGYLIENTLKKKYIATSEDSSYKEPEEAAEVAIKYCLVNLI